ncbi:MAG TPA: dienelactone hydrolase family protein [Polyangiaceae bacterium]|nr:dienelactone hydrolase family protein [Polyangiaceae bacterium]
MSLRAVSWVPFATTALGLALACSSSDGQGSQPGPAGFGGAAGDLGAGGVAYGGGAGAPAPPATCGNGALDSGEACDGSNLAGQTCESATLNARPNGTLSCTASCTLDATGCTSNGPGNGTGGAGTGGSTGTGGSGGPSGGTTGSGGGGGVGGGGTIADGQSCTGFSLTPVSDYGARGPFAVKVVTGTGPSGQYTLFRPETLGDGGFVHPPMTWGNGITTTPDLYTELLSTFASHGFVVIASNSTNVTADLMTSGLDWLVAQNTTAGEFQGKLAPKCAVTVGYSLGGGAAVNAASHDGVVATVSFHGLQGASELAKGPVILFTSTADGFVTKAGYVQPCYDRSTVQPTILATLQVNAPADFAGHLYPLGGAGDERAPAVAWLRYWVYGDQGARSYFYGTDCKLCQAPWTDIQRKNHAW